MGGLGQVAGVAISYQRRQLSAKANCEGAMPLPSMIALMVPSGRTRPRILITWSEGSLGVPCSPNRHLEELRIFRQIDLPGRQIRPPDPEEKDLIPITAEWRGDSDFTLVPAG